jgi:hypothetical protein
MKKALLILCIMSLFLIGAKEPIAVARFTIINKSGMDIAVQLTNFKTDPEDKLFYYLKVEAGENETISQKTFIIEKDSYFLQLFYLETYDPVYGYRCDTQQPTKLFFFRNTRITFLPCGFNACSPGEPSMRKFAPKLVAPPWLIQKRILKWMYIY